VRREGQLIFFAQFLRVGGRWERFVSNSALSYEGNRGSRVVDVLGRATLSVLCGHWRYAHINAVRGDTLNPGLLGMSTTVSEDVVRRAIKRRRLHDAEAGSLLTDGQSGRADLQLVAPLGLSLRRRAPSGGDHQSAGLLERSGSAARSSKPTQSQSQLAARKQCSARRSYRPCQQHLTTLLAHCGAMEHPTTLDFVLTYFSPLARRQMARNAPGGSRLTPLGLRYALLLVSTPVKTVGLASV
jgi:hypothetical protein